MSGEEAAAAQPISPAAAAPTPIRRAAAARNVFPDPRSAVAISIATTVALLALWWAATEWRWI
ncbi:MAG: hypothetical protein NZM07_11305, partial [Elioraea sp.]|nr:hypothetical protein [Elioraea sp.]